MPTIAAPALREYLHGVFCRLGMTDGNAELCSRDLVMTNLWGVDSHGAIRLPIYAERLEKQIIKAIPQVRTLAGEGAFRILDGDAGMGFVVGHRAMSEAIACAGKWGIGAVSVRNSNHFGAAALYCHQAVKSGLIGLAMTNVQPNLVAPGGARPLTGNNPIAFGAPTRLGFPFMLDIAMSTVAGGKLIMARERGESIPLDWATDSKGRPTNDPGKGFEGFLLPVGGHKGFGLSLVVDILSGLISGGLFQRQLRGMYTEPELPSGTGHFLMAIDPGLFLGEEAFLDRMDSFYQAIKTSPVSESGSVMYMPGEIEHETLLRRTRTGIPLPATLLKRLNEMASDLGVDGLSLPD